jgi:HK97 family phage prohead protease
MLRHEFQVRDADVTGRTVRLACVPYDRPAPVADANGDPYLEQFQRGAFRNVVKAPHVVQLLHDHRPGVGFGYARSLTEEPTYLVGEWRVPKSEPGDQLLALVTDEQLRGVSVGFQPGDHPEDNVWVDNVLTRRYVARMPEVSLTPAPVYDDAKVLEIRHRQQIEADRARERERWKWRTLPLQ